jgi:hypothetical protein
MGTGRGFGLSPVPHRQENIMRVRMLEYIQGTRNGKQWPPRGGYIDLPQGEAENLMAHGYAVAAPEEHYEQPVERAIVEEQTQVATIKPKPTKGRKKGS